MSDDEVIELLEIAKRHLSRVKLEFDRLKAELNSLEDEKSNSAKEHQRLCNKISENGKNNRSASNSYKEFKRRKL